MTLIRNTFFLALGLALIVWSAYQVLNLPAPVKYQTYNLQPTTLQLSIGESILQVEVADTDEKRIRGLSGRETLGPHEGLLFVFPNSGHHGFWMKEMYFPIDIIWLDEDRRVVHIEREVRPETFPYVFYPEKPARYVLEVANARSFELGIDIGTEAFFNLEN